MPENITREKALKRYKSLPQDLQEAIISPEAAAVNRTIKKDFGLSQEETIRLTDEIGLVLLGFVPLDNFAQKVRERIDLPEDTLTEIVHAVEERVFDPVRESLESIQPEAEGPKDAAVTQQNPEPAPEENPRKFRYQEALQEDENAVTPHVTTEKPPEAPPRAPKRTREITPAPQLPTRPQRETPRYTHDPYREEAEDWEE